MNTSTAPIRYGSVCSGIEAASTAWEPLGWQAAWFAEIEPFPSAVLAHHWPHVQNLGDMTTIAARVRDGDIEAPDVLVGGTPCQAFSVAGLRGGLSDARGQLTLSYVDLANAIDSRRSVLGLDPCVTCWENVPGVLSSKDNAFGCFLGALAGESCELQPPGGKWSDAGCVFGPQRAVAWRVIDAQYFGLAQRRRRVFVVSSAREGFNPAEVLFEFDGVRRDSPPSREAGESFTHDVAPCLTSSGRGIERTGETRGQDPVVAVGAFRMVAFGEYSDDGTASTMKARDYKDHTDLAVTVVHGTQDPCVSSDVAFALGRNNGGENAVFSVSLRGREGGATAELGDEVAGCLRASTGGGDKPHVLAPVVCVTGDITHTLKADGFDGSEDGTGRGVPITPAIAVRTAQTSSNGWGVNEHTAYTLDCAQGQAVAHNMAVRRLTPVECARLQGFPDTHCQIPWRGKPADQCPDGPQYKAFGNSKAIPCVRFIGERIDRDIRNAMS